VVERLFSKHKTLSSNPSIDSQKQNKTTKKPPNNSAIEIQLKSLVYRKRNANLSFFSVIVVGFFYHTYNCLASLFSRLVKIYPVFSFSNFFYVEFLIHV
jgi:hypothetical protein